MLELIESLGGVEKLGLVGVSWIIVYFLGVMVKRLYESRIKEIKEQRDHYKQKCEQLENKLIDVYKTVLGK